MDIEEDDKITENEDTNRPVIVGILDNFREVVENWNEFMITKNDIKRLHQEITDLIEKAQCISDKINKMLRNHEVIKE